MAHLLDFKDRGGSQAIWEYVATIQDQFSELIHTLRDKAAYQEGGIVTEPDHQPPIWRVYSRRTGPN